MLGLQADESMNVDNAPASRRVLLESSLKRSPPPAAFGLETIVWPAYRATLDAADTAVPVENRDARAQGIVGHLLFEGLAAMHARGVAFSPNVAATARRLLEEGASVESARAFAERVVAWFSTASTRANVQFLFNATHPRRNTEWSLPGAPDDATQMRVDYTFVTAENVRWVIDFKFAEPGAGVDQSAWRAAQLAQYRAQLLSYVARVRALDASSSQVSDGATRADRPIRAALYFPWIDCLEEMTL